MCDRQNKASREPMAAERPQMRAAATAEVTRRGCAREGEPKARLQLEQGSWRANTRRDPCRDPKVPSSLRGVAV